METAILEKKKRRKSQAGRRMSLTRYQEWVKEQEDGYKYEWNNGVIEKSEYTMRNTERKIVKKLSRAFTKTKVYDHGGELMAETECLLPSNSIRIPDLAFFTESQIDASAVGEQPIPAWVIEIISKNDNANRVKNKLNEYFDAGVQVVWHIYPALEIIEVYTSLKDVTICTDRDTCTAAPALDDFSLTVQEVFNK